MPLDLSWKISAETILAMIGWLGTIMVFMFRRGGAERGLAADVVQLQKDRDGQNKVVDAMQVSFNAGIREVRDRLAEFQADAAKTYATKQEVMALEERTVKGMDRIVDRLDQISGRLETIGENVLKALLGRVGT